MKNRNRLFTTFLIGISYCLFFLVNDYHVKQTMLFLESNDLYSADHVIVKDDLATIVGETFASVDDLSVFVILKDTSDLKIRGYFAKSYADKSFPLKEGEFFSQQDSKEALVGENVKTIKKGNEEYYVYKNKEYKIIGHLGISKYSFLSNSVLINDKTLFSQEKQPLIVDGNLSKEEYEGFYNEGTYYKKNIGLDRKINADFFSPIIYFFSLFIIFMSNILIAYIICLDVRAANKVDYLFGKSTLYRYLKNIRYLIISCLLAIVPALIIGCLTSYTSTSYLLIFIKIVLAESISLLVLLTLFLIKEERWLRKWN